MFSPPATAKTQIAIRDGWTGKAGRGDVEGGCQDALEGPCGVQVREAGPWAGDLGSKLEPLTRIELVTFPLPRGCSAAELQRHLYCLLASRGSCEGWWGVQDSNL